MRIREIAVCFPFAVDTVAVGGRGFDILFTERLRFYDDDVYAGLLFLRGKVPSSYLRGCTGAHRVIVRVNVLRRCHVSPIETNSYVEGLRRRERRRRRIDDNIGSFSSRFTRDVTTTNAIGFRKNFLFYRNGE